MGGVNKSWRICCPRSVPPGSRVVTTDCDNLCVCNNVCHPLSTNHCCDRRSWVVLPHPSTPSNTISLPRMPPHTQFTQNQTLDRGHPNRQRWMLDNLE